MRRFLKRAALVLLILLILAQVPFIYRRYTIGRVAEKIARLEADRVVRDDPQYNEYKGVIHVHTSLGGHSTGSFDELIDAANANDLDFVLMTEHYTDAYDTAALTLNGVYGKTLFIGGNEIDTADGDRFLMIPGSAEAAALRKMSTASVMEKLHADGRLAVVTYPEKFRSWESAFDGDEVFSLHTNAKSMNPLTAVFDMIWSYPAYPELTFARYFRRPDENLRKFDEIAAARKISLFAGSDAHSNLGFHFFGDDAGNRLLNIKLDPYKTVLRLVRIHVLITKGEPVSRENLVGALRRGHFFVGFDVLGDTTGFSFTAVNGADASSTVGDEVPFSDAVLIRIASPLKARLVLFRNGVRIRDEAAASELSLKPDGPGVYRVEAYLDGLESPYDAVPWVITNPIYVR